MIELHLHGLGLFTPGFPDASAWARRAPAAPTAPRAEILPPALRRRATALACMVASTAAQAAAEAGADLARVPFVFGSTLGEISLTVAMLEEFWQGEGLPSPTRFHTSVHNGPAAYVSIATLNRGFSTALSAGAETPAAALVEAAALLSERGGEVLVALADEPPPSPFEKEPPFPPLALSFLLSADAQRPRRASLRALRRESAGPPRVPAPFAAHPAAGALALLQAVEEGAKGPVPLGPDGPRGWVAEILPGSRP